MFGFKKNAGERLAVASLGSVRRGRPSLARAYARSIELFPDLSGHYTAGALDDFWSEKMRHLLASQADFVTGIVGEVIKKKGSCDLLDIGDSDGTLQLLVRSLSGENGNLATTGLNLQEEAVRRIQERGLSAIHADAAELKKQGREFDVVSVLETLEHLPDPIGFLESLHGVVGERLIISVPFVRQSGVSLGYLMPDDFGDRPATIETVHIFELAPADWKKLFLHAGWRVSTEWTAYQYPHAGLLRMTAPLWRRLDYEGFWLASFIEDFGPRRAYSIDGVTDN